MSFFSTKKPLAEWKWYVRESDFSLHHSPDPVSNAIEIAAPPQDNGRYTWDWGISEWILNTPRLKRVAEGKVNLELDRLKKFDGLNTVEKALIESDLIAYRETLRLFIKNFDPMVSFPSIPPSLTDENFFAL